MKIDVAHLAKLANLKLTPKGTKRIQAQLSLILGYINQLNEVSTENIQPSSQVTNLKNAFREDTSTPSLLQEEVLSNTKSKHNGLFKVKSVFEE